MRIPPEGTCGVWRTRDRPHRNSFHEGSCSPFGWKPVPKLDFSAHAVMTRGGGSAARLRCCWTPARFSIPVNLGMNLGLHGFVNLGSTSNNKEWQFFGGQKCLSSMIPI
jgi:hypothetical protein